MGSKQIPEKPRILHVSGDFPDPFERSKTPVIRDLIDLTRQRYDHDVLSINRVAPGLLPRLRKRKSGAPIQSEFEYGMAIQYRAPPLGIWHWARLVELGDWLADTIFRSAQRPDLLIGHKLTIEGIVVARAAERVGIPYALTIQGNTDTKILSARPDLSRRFANIYHRAAGVFAFAPWSLSAIEKRLGPRQSPALTLPCPTDLDTAHSPIERGKGLVSVFHLKNYREKNLAGIVSTMRHLSFPTRLQIIGGGDAADEAACRGLARNVPQIEFAGPLDRARVQSRLNEATGLLLPSLRESFGLVFIEALFAGAPIIYPKGAAVDGYFDAMPFALRVDARNPRIIADAVEHLVMNERDIKRALASWQKSAHARQFERAQIADTFCAGLQDALGGPGSFVS